MTGSERWTLRFVGVMTLVCLIGVTAGIFGSGPRWGLVIATIGMTTGAIRFAELADKALRGVVRRSDERPEGRR